MEIYDEYESIREKMYNLGYMSFDTFDEKRGWVPLGDGSKYYVIKGIHSKFIFTEKDLEKSLLGRCSIEEIFRHYNMRENKDGQLKLFDEKYIFSKDKLCAALILKIELSGNY